MSEYQPNTGERLRRLREKLWLTQVQLAKRAGVCPRTVQTAEGGGGVSIPTRRKLLLALGIPFERRGEVFGDD